jgi:hypothetical protein
VWEEAGGQAGGLKKKHKTGMYQDQMAVPRRVSFEIRDDAGIIGPMLDAF